MWRRRSDDGQTFWLSLAGQPCVVEVLAALARASSPMTFAELRASIGDVRVREIAAALRRLGACEFVRRLSPCVGTWDGRMSLNTRFELTDAGADFTQALDMLGKWVVEHHIDMAVGASRS